MENLLVNVIKDLIEFRLVLRDLHPMMFFRVSPHSLQRCKFSTKFAGSFATVNHVIAEFELFQIFGMTVHVLHKVLVVLV